MSSGAPAPAPGGTGKILPRYDDNLIADDLGFGSKNTSSYIELSDSRYNDSNVKATLILYKYNPKKGEEKVKSVLQTAFDKLANTVKGGTPPKELDGIYFGKINVNNINSKRKDGDKSKPNLYEGLIELAQNPKSIFYELLFNKPRWDPYDSKVKEAERSTDKYKYDFTITLEGDKKPRSKFPFIVVYIGRWPKYFYEGPFGEAGDEQSPEYKEQENFIISILKNFIEKYVSNPDFKYTDTSEIDRVRKEQWYEYNKKFKVTQEGIGLDIFNYFDSARVGFLYGKDPSGKLISTFKPVIPAIPSFVCPKPKEAENMLGQKDNDKNPWENEVIITIPKLLPMPKRDFKPYTNEQEKIKQEAEKKQLEFEKQKVELDNIRIKQYVEGIYMPAIPAFYLDEKGKPVTIQRLNKEDFKQEEDELRRRIKQKQEQPQQGQQQKPPQQQPQQPR